MKKVVFAYGRFNPPHKGHAKLIDMVKKTAEVNESGYLIVASHKHDNKINPLTREQKQKYMNLLFPNTIITIAEETMTSFMHYLKILSDVGYDTCIFVAGSDRVDELQRVADKYNGIEYKFNNIAVISAGTRDPDAMDVRGTSATKMREYAAAEDFESFQKGLPKAPVEIALNIFRDVQAGMKPSQ